jgi:ATP-binding cassette, subfamily B, multidrug efflux pump
VIEGGRIAEVGTHDELIASRGVYHHLYELQHAEPNAVTG